MDPQTTQATTESAGWLWNFFTIGGTLASLVTAIGAFIVSARRHPPLPEELYKDFARKGDLDKLRDDIKEELSQGSKLFRETERTLGRLEGLLDRCPYLCARPNKEKNL